MLGRIEKHIKFDLMSAFNIRIKLFVQSLRPATELEGVFIIALMYSDIAQIVARRSKSHVPPIEPVCGLLPPQSNFSYANVRSHLINHARTPRFHHGSLSM